MSAEARVIKATFSDWRPVKSRKVLQIVLEVPIEQTEDVLTRLGAPMPDQEKWVAVALLVPNTIGSVDPKAQLKDMLERSLEHEKAKDLDRSLAAKERYADADEMEQARTRAALYAKDPEFQMWTGYRTEETCAAFIRRTCRVSSRSDIATDHQAYNIFLKLERHFTERVGRIAESRG